MENHKTTAKLPATLLNDLHALVAEAEKIMGDSLANPTEEAVGALRARLEAAQDSLSALYSRARKHVVAGARYTDETLRANPYQSIAIAAGVGLLVGVIAGRASK